MRRAGPSGAKSSRLAVWSWALYDFSNTIFSVSILTFFFPLWVDELVGSGAFLVNAATAVAALLVVLTAPALGAVADLRQRRVPYLVALTLAAVFLTAALDVADAVGGVAVGLALFVAADLCYQSALVFYNALLPGVAAGRGTGRVSGYGTALGYVGSVVALLVLSFFVTDAATVRSLLGPFGGWIGVLPDATEGPNSNAFLPTAFLYLAFSLPAFFFVPDPRVRAPRPVALSAAYRDVFATVRNLRAYAGVGVFLVATLLYMDAANTAVANMALYGREVFGLGTGEVTNLLLFSTVFAVVGSAAWGFASDAAGPKRALLGILALWVVSIGLAAAALAPWMLFAAGPLVGIALGGTWTVSRAYLVALSPPEKLGEFFGLFSMAGKVSAVLGPAVTAFLLFVLGGFGTGAYRISIASLILFVLAGAVLLLRVPDARPNANANPKADPKTTGAAGTPARE